MKNRICIVCHKPKWTKALDPWTCLTCRRKRDRHLLKSAQNAWAQPRIKSYGHESTPPPKPLIKPDKGKKKKGGNRGHDRQS